MDAAYGTVTFRRLAYTKGSLERAPRDEAVAYLMAAQLHNDMACLLKIVLQNPVLEDDPLPARCAAATMQFMAFRMLAGRTSEGWSLIEGKFQHYLKSYLRDKLVRQVASDSLGWLKDYFAQTNLVRLVRNKVGFHAERDVFEQSYDGIPADTELEDFHNISVGNTVFYGAELILTQAVISLSTEPNPSDALNSMLEQVREVASRMLDVTNAFVLGFCRTHLSQEMKELGGDVIDVPNQPNEIAMRVRPFLWRRAAASLERSLASRRYLDTVSPLALQSLDRNQTRT